MIERAHEIYPLAYAGTGTLLDDREAEIVREVLTSGESLSQGPWRALFEAQFAQRIGTRYAFSATSGTVALELAIHLLDLEPGDEVIVTPQTFQATIQPLLDYDVVVRFADIRPTTMNIDPDSVADLINERTRAILLVHYGGLPAEMDRIMELARRHDLLVLEDAAHALGGSYRGRAPGQLGDIACFSFHSNKNITTLGEGGMITFDRADWADRLERLRSNESDADFEPANPFFGDFSAPPPGAIFVGQGYTHRCVGWRRAGTNATLSEPAAAVGTVQLEKLPQMVQRRQQIAARMTEVLRAVEGVELIEVPDDVVHPYHLFTFLARPESGVDRDRLILGLWEQGVETRLRYFPLHLTPEWRARGHEYGECPVAERLWFTRQVNLPCQPSLTDEQTDYLVTALMRALAHCG